MILKGTEKMQRYRTPWGRGTYGIPSYGAVKINGRRAYKVAKGDLDRLMTVGWRAVGGGTHYDYVAQP